MVLVTNIYGEAAQLEETVRKDSQGSRLASILRRVDWVN